MTAAICDADTSRHGTRTGTPDSLVVLACDAALRFLASAELAQTSGRSSDFALNVYQAQRILVELLGALDFAVAPEATESLRSLYQTLFDRLTDALAGDAGAVAETRESLSRLRNAWAGAARTAFSQIRGVWACRANR